MGCVYIRGLIYYYIRHISQGYTSKFVTYLVIVFVTKIQELVGPDLQL